MLQLRKVGQRKETTQKHSRRRGNQNGPNAFFIRRGWLTRPPSGAALMPPGNTIPVLMGGNVRAASRFPSRASILLTSASRATANRWTAPCRSRPADGGRCVHGKPFSWALKNQAAPGDQVTILLSQFQS